jgi:4-hydroxybenzoyl-CoA reductase subunit beta
MLPLPLFQFHSPRSLDEALHLLKTHEGARLIAGGTDLLPNLKHRLLEPAHIISVRELPGLAQIETLDDGALRLGALCTLAQVRDSALVQEQVAALSEAAGHVASPQIQNMGTLGGNVLLDTRCVYYNQTLFWRQALGYCLKKDGTACHVVKGGKNCVAAHSSDTAPVLLALGAHITFVGPQGERTLPLSQLYKTPGDDHLRCQPNEILTHITIPPRSASLRSGYEKLRTRESIDFPALNMAAAVDVDANGVCTHFSLFISALGAVPKAVGGASVVGKVWDDALRDGIAEDAFKRCVPLTSIHVDPNWRREMAPVLVKKLLGRL